MDGNLPMTNKSLFCNTTKRSWKTVSKELSRKEIRGQKDCLNTLGGRMRREGRAQRGPVIEGTRQVSEEQSKLNIFKQNKNITIGNILALAPQMTFLIYDSIVYNVSFWLEISSTRIKHSKTIYMKGFEVRRISSFTF